MINRDILDQNQCMSCSVYVTDQLTSDHRIICSGNHIVHVQNCVTGNFMNRAPGSDKGDMNIKLEIEIPK